MLQSPLIFCAVLQSPLPSCAVLQSPLPSCAVLQSPLPSCAALQSLLIFCAVPQFQLPSCAWLQSLLPSYAVLQSPLPSCAVLLSPLFVCAVLPPPFTLFPSVVPTCSSFCLRSLTSALPLRPPSVSQVPSVHFSIPQSSSLYNFALFFLTMQNNKCLCEN